MKVILIAALLVWPVAHRQDSPPELDQEFKIKVGQEVSFDNLRIRFDAVAEDRRCACDQQCSSLRNAAVIFGLESPQTVSRKIVLTAYSDSSPDEARSRGYRIRLLKLDPCRKSYGSSIASSEYEATMLVTKDQTEGGLDPNSKPNFNGGWRHREALDAGVTLIVSHRGPEMEVTRLRFARGIDSVTKKTYRIDGQSHTATQIQYREDSSTKQKEDYKTSSFKSQAGWEENKLVIVENGERSEWELSENGKHLILTTGTRKVVYQKTDDR